jgi:hypothetical protein
MSRPSGRSVGRGSGFRRSGTCKTTWTTIERGMSMEYGFSFTSTERRSNFDSMGSGGVHQWWLTVVMLR